jgi:hypothetical protein
MTDHRITFKLEDEERTVVLSTDNEWITLGELFMLWVDFASGCGYVVNKEHALDVWDGLDSLNEIEPKLAKAIQALEGVKEFAEDKAVLAPHLGQRCCGVG